MANSIHDGILTCAVPFEDKSEDDEPSALLEDTCHGYPVKHIGYCISVDEPGDRIIGYDAQVMHAKLQYTCRNEKAYDSCDEIAKIRLFPVPYAPEDE